MDVRPQRPLRALRVQDENAPVQSGLGKALHQRNKSTPALSTLMPTGGIKGAVKRTVFADVSNTARAQPAKDDMIINGKKFSIDASAILPELSKSSVFARPPQRPLAPKSTQPTSSSGAVTGAKPIPQENVVTGANARKALSKRSTNISRDKNNLILQDVIDQPLRQRASTTTAVPYHKALGSYHDIPHIRPQQEQLIIEPITSTVIEEELKESSPVEVQHEEVIEPVAPLNVKLPEETDSDSHALVSEPAENSLDSLVEQQTSLEYIDALEFQARLLQGEHAEELAQQTDIASLPEPEEYWDEEEEDEYYDADGYTTAGSIRSRGDNTTGGITLVLAPRVTAKVQRELEAAKVYVESTMTPEDIEEELCDTSMVVEYGEEIFDYLKELEERMRPNPYYMDNQPQIQWSMRAVLMGWIVQVHHRFSLLPETLFLTANYIDRFLSCKVVSVEKLQLVGATAIFVAAKYEEINCPSVQEIVFMVDSGYTVDEILKAERFMLSMLQFELGWPGPMSFLRRISKADDYDLETRTLAKYFLEITIMDERFVGCAPSFLAAGAHCLSRLMLKKGDWSPAHVHYSGYTYSQIRNLVSVILECCEAPQEHHTAVYEKYADKRFKRASLFVETELQKGFELPPVPRESFASYSHSWRRK